MARVVQRSVLSGSARQLFSQLTLNCTDIWVGVIAVSTPLETWMLLARPLSAPNRQTEVSTVWRTTRMFNCMD